jgi:hypothetical protein
MAERSNDDPADREGDALPELPSLRTGLREACRSDDPVPAARDRLIRAAIQDHFAADIGRRPVIRRIGPWAAAAAAVIAIAAWLAHPWRTPSTPSAPFATSVEPADLDRNGRVDILDAFALARRLDAGDTPESTLDLNRDGAVDARDVDLLALRAVALDEGAG